MQRLVQGCKGAATPVGVSKPKSPQRRWHAVGRELPFPAAASSEQLPTLVGLIQGRLCDGQGSVGVVGGVREYLQVREYLTLACSLIGFKPQVELGLQVAQVLALNQAHFTWELPALDTVHLMCLRIVRAVAM